MARDSSSTNRERHTNPVPHKIKYSEDSDVCPALNYKLGEKGHISRMELQGQLCWFINPNVVSDHKNNLSDLVM